MPGPLVVGLPRTAKLPKGTLLGVAVYSPGSELAPTFSGAIADIDATNVAVTFTLKVQQDVTFEIDVNLGGTAQCYIGVREGTTLFQEGILELPDGGARQNNFTFLIPNVKAGTHTFKGTARTVSGTLTIYFGPTRGSCAIYVRAA